MNSIFNRSNTAIEKVFAEAGKPEKVMCVPIDYAKKTHTALVCTRRRCDGFVHQRVEGGSSRAASALIARHSIPCRLCS